MHNPLDCVAPLANPDQSYAEVDDAALAAWTHHGANCQICELGYCMPSEFSAMVDEDRGLIDRQMFSDPDVYAAEMERIFRRCWLLLGHLPGHGNRTTWTTGHK